MNTFRIPEYKKRISLHETELKTVKQKHLQVSLLRLLFFILSLISWFYLFTINTTFGTSLGTVSVVVFIVLIKIHKKIEDKKQFIEIILSLNKKEQNACNGDFSGFDNGDEFVDSSHPYSYDVDLFGEGSFFQYLNRTVIGGGKILLKKWLSETPLKKKVIKQNQQAVEELSDMIDFRQKFYTVGKMYKSNSDETSGLQKWLKSPDFFGSKLIVALTVGLPVVTLLSLIMAILGNLSIQLFIFLFLANLTIIGFRISKFNKSYVLLSDNLNTLKKMTNLFELIESLDVKSELLKRLKDAFYSGEESAKTQIAKLIKIADSLDNRNNIVLGFILNGLLFWDWNHMLFIDKWKSKHSQDYNKWQESLHYFDALNSLATLAYNNVDFTFPQISDDEYILDAKNTGHPLIPEKDRVCNDFSIGESPRYAIITGANMAGKSTFLRTVAINLILAGCGAPVCAEKFTFTPLPLYSSMRAEDSLLKHESYFFAELKRLQNITKELDKDKKLFIILDEILRGTNSEDKRKGSIGFIKKITSKKAYGLVATHDLELARLTETQSDIFKALCFEVKIEDNKLDFNYKLQPGITQNMNASFLMKQMGIIDS